MAKEPFVAGKLTYKMLGVAFAVPTGIVMKKAVDAAWRKVRHTDPPKDPGADDITWVDALAWAAVSAAALTAGQLIAQRLAGATYQKLTGHEPPIDTKED